VKVILLSAAAFLIGSIPTGQLIAVSKGIDLRMTGSGNIGATNVLRTTGKLPALLTLFGDALKGALAVWLARFFDAGVRLEGVIGLLAILGHNFSIFLNFRGGKGVATSLGVLGVFAPVAALVTVLVWLATVLVTRYSSLGAIVSFSLLPLSIVVLDAKEKLPIAVIISIIVLLRHKDNIRRLMQGTESKVGSRT
jgi:glycerol-3-phosphate acyltransferase PlsY